MFQKTLSDITAYMDFLRANGYAVSISCADDVLKPCIPALIMYELRPLPICDYLKKNPATQNECRMTKTEREAQIPTEPSYTCCYAGVEEFVVPVKYHERTILCVHLTGFRGAEKLSRERYLSVRERYGPDDRFDSLYASLDTRVPAWQTVNAMLTPLCYMLERLYAQCCEHGAQLPVMDAYRKALVFIRDNYTDGITVADVARAIGYSVSYFGYVFKKNHGSSASRYIADLQLAKAAELLRGTDFSISDIAEKVGFGDANYFSTAFRTRYGVSPRTYRKQNP